SSATPPTSSGRNCSTPSTSKPSTARPTTRSPCGPPSPHPPPPPWPRSSPTAKPPTLPRCSPPKIMFRIWHHNLEGPLLHDHRAGKPPGIGPSPGSGPVARAGGHAQGGAQQGFRCVGGRARGDRAGMGAVKLTQLDAVKGDPCVVDREFQLPGC